MVSNAQAETGLFARGTGHRGGHQGNNRLPEVAYGSGDKSTFAATLVPTGKRCQCDRARSSAGASPVSGDLAGLEDEGEPGTAERRAKVRFGIAQPLGRAIAGLALRF
jgi:hypothetical protein